MTTPFSHLLKKGEKFIWDDKCYKSLDNTKVYLTNPQVLASYDSERGLFLYISETMNDLGAMLAQKDDNNKERAIYNIIKTLHDYETSYTLIENISFTILFAMEKLRHYMLGNKTCHRSSRSSEIPHVQVLPVWKSNKVGDVTSRI